MCGNGKKKKDSFFLPPSMNTWWFGDKSLGGTNQHWLLQAKPTVGQYFYWITYLPFLAQHGGCNACWGSCLVFTFCLTALSYWLHSNKPHIYWGTDPKFPLPHLLSSIYWRMRKEQTSHDCVIKDCIWLMSTQADLNCWGDLNFEAYYTESGSAM